MHGSVAVFDIHTGWPSLAIANMDAEWSQLVTQLNSIQLKATQKQLP